jgi:hypothetical protein
MEMEMCSATEAGWADPETPPSAIAIRRRPLFHVTIGRRYPSSFNSIIPRCFRPLLGILPFSAQAWSMFLSRISSRISEGLTQKEPNDNGDSWL